jgi:hypothetical protein
MTQYNITIARDDLRWLGVTGGEKKKREERDYIFKSSITDDAKFLLEDKKFSGNYVRFLPTERIEGQNLSLAMLTFSERCSTIVGSTLEGLMKDKVTKSIVNLPSGRVLYELLENKEAFNVSTDSGIKLPEYYEGYAEIDLWQTDFFGKGRLAQSSSQREITKQVESIMGQVYIEFQPEYVAKLAVVDLMYGPRILGTIRRIAEKAKNVPMQLKPNLMKSVIKTLDAKRKNFELPEFWKK